MPVVGRLTAWTYWTQADDSDALGGGDVVGLAAAAPGRPPPGPGRRAADPTRSRRTAPAGGLRSSCAIGLRVDAVPEPDRLRTPSVVESRDRAGCRNRARLACRCRSAAPCARRGAAQRQRARCENQCDLIAASPIHSPQFRLPSIAHVARLFPIQHAFAMNHRVALEPLLPRCDNLSSPGLRGIGGRSLRRIRRRHGHQGNCRGRHRRRIGPGRGDARASLRGAAPRSRCSTATSERGEKVAAEIGGIFCEVDVTSDEKVAAAFAKAREAHGQERVLVNCAGVANAAKTVGRDKETKASRSSIRCSSSSWPSRST